MTEVTVKLKNEFLSDFITIKDKHTYHSLYPLTIYQTEENQVL